MLDGVSHRFAERDTLFRPVSLTLRPGTTYALTGPSGAGKSTLLNIIAGWLHPSEGTVTRTAIHTVGWVFQNPHGVPRRSALDHVALPLLADGLRRAEAETRANETLNRFGLSGVADRPFKALSGGEAQRLMLARALAIAPSLLLVDEPTAQLDARTAERVNDALTHVATGGSIVVIATHDEKTRDSCDEQIALSI